MIKKSRPNKEFKTYVEQPDFGPGMPVPDTDRAGQTSAKSKVIPASRGNAKLNKKHGNYSNVSMSDLSIYLIQPFPTGGELWNFKDKVPISYRLDLSVLQQAKCIFVVDDSNLRIVSAPDNLCAWKCLASIAYEDDLDPEACLESFNQANRERAILEDGSLSNGHLESTLKIVCARLGVNCMSLPQLQYVVENVKTGDYKDKYNVKAPMFPSLILHEGHASLAFLDTKKKFSYRQLTEAFYFPETHLKSEKIPISNSPKLQEKKRTNRQIRRSQAVKNQPRTGPAEVQTQSKPKPNSKNSESQNSKINYSIRQMLKLDITTLPLTHSSDGDVAIFCMNWSLQLRTADVPIIKSQTAFVFLSSLQKKKNPDIFQFKSTVQVSSYKFNPELFTSMNPQQVVSGRIIPPTFEKGVKTTAILNLIFDEDKPDLKRLKTVSLTAQTQAKTGMILQTYTGKNGSAITLERSEMKFNPFSHSPCQFRNGKLFCANTIVNLQGSVPSIFWDWISMWGLDMTRNSMKSVAHTSGGHSCLRTLANLMLAKCQDYIVERLLDPITPDDNSAITLVVPGDKFKKTQGALDISLGWKPTILYPRSDNHREETQLVALRALWDDMVLAVRRLQDYDAMSNHERNQQFLILLRQSPSLHGNAFRQSVVAAMGNRRRITHRSVRPNTEAYDREYYSSNHDKALNAVWFPGHPDHEYIIGKIEDHDLAYDHRVIYCMSDVHYYLYGWNPTNQKDKDWFVCTGNNFSHLPGRVVLPFGEGIVTVTGDARIIMNTRGSALHYIHDHVKLCNPTAAYDFGFFQIAMSCGHPRDFKLYKYEKTGFDTHKSLQANFLISALDKISNTKSAAIASEDLLEPYSEQDATAFIDTLENNPAFREITRDKQIQIFSYFKDPPVIYKSTHTTVSQNIIYDLICGPKIQQVTSMYTPPTSKINRECMTRAEYRAIRQAERLDPCNAQGLIDFLLDSKPAVPHFTPQQKAFMKACRRPTWKQKIENSIFPNTSKARALPVKIDKFTIQNGIEQELVYSGRPEQQPERGMELFNELSIGTSSESHIDIMSAYIDRLDTQQVLRTQALKSSKEYKKMKVNAANSKNTIKMEGYYMNKSPDLRLFDAHNPYITKDPLQYHLQVDSFVRLVDTQTQQMAIFKNQLVPFEQVVSGKLVTKSGSTIL